VSYTPGLGRGCLDFAMDHAEAVSSRGIYVEDDCRGRGACPKLTHGAVHNAGMLFKGSVNRPLSLFGRQRTYYTAEN
jgi:hypothetical protein